jgi:CubicO group peptidase (beta-lactamase class C family)
MNNASNWLSVPSDNVMLHSDEGTSLAALIVERVVGISYEEYVKEKIIKSLGLESEQVGFRLSDLNDREALVTHYTYAENAYSLDRWHQALLQLNITSISVSIFIEMTIAV